MVVKDKLILRSENILGGTPVFAGTRVPVQTLIDYLKHGHSLDEFLDDFPTVRREQAEGLRAELRDDADSRATS